MNPLFWYLCLPARVALAAVVLCVGLDVVAVHPLWGLVLVAMGVGFFVHVFSKRQRGYFDGPIWWKHYRPVHGITYTTAGACFIGQIPLVAALILSFDALFAVLVAMRQQHIDSQKVQPAQTIPSTGPPQQAYSYYDHGAPVRTRL